MVSLFSGLSLAGELPLLLSGVVGTAAIGTELAVSAAVVVVVEVAVAVVVEGLGVGGEVEAVQRPVERKMEIKVRHTCTSADNAPRGSEEEGKRKATWFR